MIDIWWVWAVAAVALLALEVLAPGFVFLGFGIGAGVVTLGLLLGLIGPGAPALLLIFAVASLLAWVAMRRLFSRGRGQVKVWDKDINDDV